MNKKRVSFSLPGEDKKEINASFNSDVVVTVSNVKGIKASREVSERLASKDAPNCKGRSLQSPAKCTSLKKFSDADSDSQSHESITQHDLMNGNHSHIRKDAGQSVNPFDAEEPANLPTSSTTVSTDEEDHGIARRHPSAVNSFCEMALDPRLERAIEHMGWEKPTPVQAAVVPLTLQGHDLLVCSPTGSGKTASYAIPIIQQVCRACSKSCPSLRAVVLVPTRELVSQVLSVFRSLARFIDGIRISPLLAKKVSSWSLKSKNTAEKKDRLTNDSSMSFRTADVFVGTPASFKALQETPGINPLSSVQFIVVDEADLVLSYGYEKDARSVLADIPTSAQSILISATLDIEGMDSFREMVLRQHTAINVILDNGIDGIHANGATHYVAALKSPTDRYLVTYAMLRLNILCGKVLIFVNHVNAAFRLKLFLDQFKIKTAVLNSELPANSRIHCVQQFNAGLVDVLIAADELSGKPEPQHIRDGGKAQNYTKKSRRLDKDEEFGLSRGVDFQDVSAVLNFDMPSTVQSYIHRAGRTARNGKSGTVMSLVCTETDQSIISNVSKTMGVHIGPLAFCMEQIEGFRYRIEDSLRSVTDTAVRGARLADVRREMINSEQLKGHFDDNPEDLEALQHNIRLAKNVHEHLGHIPSYLIPPGMRENIEKSVNRNVKRWKGKNKRVSSLSKSADPLKKFSLSGSSRQRFRMKRGMHKNRGPHRGPALMKTRKRRPNRKKN